MGEVMHAMYTSIMYQLTFGCGWSMSSPSVADTHARSCRYCHSSSNRRSQRGGEQSQDGCHGGEVNGAAFVIIPAEIADGLPHVVVVAIAGGLGGAQHAEPLGAHLVLVGPHPLVPHLALDDLDVVPDPLEPKWLPPND